MPPNGCQGVVLACVSACVRLGLGVLDRVSL